MRNDDFLAELREAIANLDRAANALLAAALLAPDSVSTAEAERLRLGAEALREKVRELHRIN